MNNRQTEKSVRRGFTNATPDNLAEIKADCQSTSPTRRAAARTNYWRYATCALAFVLLVVLWGMSDVETITAVINSLEIADLAIRIGVLYIGFLAIYLFITLLVYCFRYVYGRKKLRQYAGHLKKVQKMYQREEKLKA